MEFSIGGQFAGIDKELAEDVYEATITELEAVTIPAFEGKGDPRPGVMVHFEIHANGIIVNGRMRESNTLGPKSNLRKKIVEPLCPGRVDKIIELTAGNTAQMNQEFVQLLEGLIGKECRVVTANKPSRDGNRNFSRIDKLMPSKAVVENADTPPPPEDPGFDDDEIPFG